MEKKKSNKGLLFAIIAVVLIAIATIVAVVMLSGHRVIKVEYFEGEVSLTRSTAEKEVVTGMNLKSEDRVTTGNDGLMELLVDTDKHILAKENTSFAIISKGSEKKGKLKIDLEYGASLIEIENKLNDDSFVEVETPNASLSVRGTTFEVCFSKESKSTFLEVQDGVVEITCGDETKKVKEGQIATVSEDSFVVTDKQFRYKEVPAFKIGHSEEGKIYDVYMKELVEWNHEVSTINDITVDEMVKDGIRIRYWVNTLDELEENLEYLEESDFLKSRETLTNDDGDEVMFAISGYEDDDGDFVASYRYYKQLPDGMYVHINVFSFDTPKVIAKKDKEEFLSLTNDCYFYFGLPEGVEEPEGNEEITIPENEFNEINTQSDFELSSEPIFELDSVGRDKMISADEVPNLFNGEVTFEELQYAIRIRDYSRMKQSQDTIKNALKIMCYEPEIAGVYSPMPGTRYSYDAEHLNRIFSVITTYWILDEYLPEGATCPWPENILTLVPATGVQEDKNYVRIIRIYYGEEENDICVDYNFRQNYNAEGTRYCEGTCCIHFAIDEETGKYRSNYIMQYDCRDVYPE